MTKKIFTLLEYLLIFLLFFIPLVDTDFGWHLRSGEYFFQYFQFEKTNNLTYFLSGYYWPNSYMSYDVLISLIYKVSGLLGLSVLYGVLGVLAYWIFRKLTKNINLTLLLFLLLYLTSYKTFDLGFRAQFLTFIFLEFELLFLLHKPRWIYSFPLLFAIWANTHGAFVLGLAVLGIFLISKGYKGNWRELGGLGIVTLLSFIAPLLNPYGIGVYQESLLHVNYPLSKLIAEWVPPGWDIRVLVIGVLGGLGWLMFKEWKKNRFLLLCFLLFTYLCLIAQRNIPLWGLIACVCFAQVNNPKWFKFLENLQLDMFKKVAIVFAIFILLFTQVPKTLNISTNKDSYCTGLSNRLDLPCKAIDFIKSNNIVGKNVYTAYEWGGYLEWQLPQYKYFTDGRMVTWNNSENKSPYTIYLELIQAQPGWNERMKGYGTDWMLIGSGTFLDIELSKNPQGWKEEYRDQTATIYTKN